MKKAEALEKDISMVADTISEANSQGIADGFSHEQLGIRVNPWTSLNCMLN